MSFVIVGKQNQIDLSWNKPSNNGYTIKNYFFYSEENVDSTSSIISYYSYALPVYNKASFVSFNGDKNGFDINAASTLYSLILNTGFTNYFDLTYGGELEISWEYHSDNPIQDICNNFVSQTTMAITVVKNNDISNVLLLNIPSRTYDSYENKLGPIPINNGKLLKDIFTITLDPLESQENKHFNKTDNIVVNVSFSSLSYIPYNANSITDRRSYSIIMKDITISPFRLPFSQDYTSLIFGNGNNNGFIINKNNALGDSYGTSGAVYYMPKLLNYFKTYENAKISISFKYNFDLSLSAVDLSNIGLTNITNISLPYRLKIRLYSRPFANSSISINKYNTTNSADFIHNAKDVTYNTYLLLDADVSYSATYSEIIRDTSNNRPNITKTLDLSGMTFPSDSNFINKQHNQFVFIYSLYLDNSLQVYNSSYSYISNIFNLTLQSYTFTPYQYYRFSGPDPTLPISNSLDGSMNTVYNIANPYDDIRTYYTFYNLTNGSFYGYKIASNNIFGTSQFSQKSIGRCGSKPNRIFSENFSVESDNQRNQISIIWERPLFSGYEIISYRVQYALDINDKWINIFDFTSDLHPNDISFNMFFNIDISNSLFDTGDLQYTYIFKPADVNNVSSQVVYRYLLQRFKYINNSLALEYGSVDASNNIILSDVLINGRKYYTQIAAINNLYNNITLGDYSTIFSGVPITFPENVGITFSSADTFVVGANLIIFTWSIPFEDGGGPILDYLIEYAPTLLDASGNRRKDNSGNSIPDTFKQYYIDNNQPNEKLDDYKFIRANQNSSDQTLLSLVETKKANLLKYKIQPTPIVLFDIDRNSISNTDLSFSNVLEIKQPNTLYRYTSSALSQNEFDLTDIQLKWYYIKDPSGVNWTVNTNINFKISINIYLTDLSNSNVIPLSLIPSLDISYNATSNSYSDPLNNSIGYKYINYLTGNIIGTNEVPKILFTDKYITDTSFSNTTIITTKYINYSYTSDILSNANFYLKNIQLKWYYLKDLSGSDWNPNTTINFKMSIVGYISNINNDNKIQIFSLPLYNPNLSFNVTKAMLSDDILGTYNYINYTTGNIIQTGGDVPIIPISKVYELNSSTRLHIDLSVTNLSDDNGSKINIRFDPIILSGNIFPLTRINKNRKLHIDVSANNLTDISGSKVHIYFAPVNINGSAPVRASKELTTNFTYTLSDNVRSRLITNTEYSFRIRPFNISDYFQNLNSNKFTTTIGIDNAEPISNPLYTFNYDGSGGSVSFKWNYGVSTQYNINITIPSEYESPNYPPNEYIINSTTENSIQTEPLIPTSNVVSFSIPSILQSDIAAGRIQTRLTNGRAYNIQIAPIKKVILTSGERKVLTAPFVTLNYVIPFVTPLRPLSLSAFTQPNMFSLSWSLPNIINDPNYYITDNLDTYYYKYSLYVIEYKPNTINDWSASTTKEIRVPISINSFPGETTRIDISSGIINDTEEGGTSYNVRLSIAIQNNYNLQYAYSEYTYMTFINNTIFTESVNNEIYASLFPTKSEKPVYFDIWKVISANNQIGMFWITPEFNGGANFYYYNFQYSLTPTIESSWIDVYDISNGIAIRSHNNLIGPSPSYAAPNISVTFILSCKSIINLNYSIRVRSGGYNTTNNGVPNIHSNPIRQAISDWSDYKTLL
jgi:hypothetical protein